MGYTRDKDAITRGPGAIASRDHANPHAAAMRAAKRQHALSIRDRALAHLTYGERGGLGTTLGPRGRGGLGALSRQSAGILESLTSPTISKGGAFEVPVLKSQRLTTMEPVMPTPPPPKPYVPPPLPPKPLIPAAVRARAAAAIRSGAATSFQPSNPIVGGGFTAVDVVNPIVVVGPAPIPPKPRPPGVVTGGGGISSGGGRPSLPSFDTAPLPDVPDGGGESSSSGNKTLLIAGAAAIGAYLFFKRKKG